MKQEDAALSEEYQTEIVTALADTAAATAQPFAIQSLLKPAHRFTFGLKPVRLLHQYGWGFAVIAVVCGFVCILLSQDKLSSLFRLSGALWCAAALWFMPAALFVGQHLPDKLALDGTLQALISTGLNTWFDTALCITAVAFGILTVLTVGFAMPLLRRKPAAVAEIPEAKATSETEIKEAETEELPQ